MRERSDNVKARDKILLPKIGQAEEQDLYFSFDHDSWKDYTL